MRREYPVRPKKHSSNNPDPIDIHVGSRVRLRRTLLGISQERLGEQLDITFQQVQKYERGANRISASKLWRLSEILDVPVGFFFDDMESADMPLRQASDLEEALSKRETLEMLREYLRLNDDVREKVRLLLRSMARATISQEEQGANSDS